MANEKIKTKFNYLLNEWKDNHNPEIAIKFIEMFEMDLLGYKEKFVGKASYFEKSVYRNKCCECGGYYEKGEPCYVQDAKKWHPECAPIEVKNAVVKNFQPSNVIHLTPQVLEAMKEDKEDDDVNFFANWKERKSK